MNNRPSETRQLPDIKETTDVPFIDENPIHIQTNPMSLPAESDAKQSLTIYTRFRHVFLSTTPPLEPMIDEPRSSKSTQTFLMPSVKRRSKHQSITVWRDSNALLSLVDVPITANPAAGEQRTVRRLRRDKRAATSLFTLVLVFMIFLLPYVVVVVVGRIFSYEILIDTNSQVYSAAFWLLWLNSTVNPILYPFIQPRFREAYRKLFFRFTRRRGRLIELLTEMQRQK